MHQLLRRRLTRVLSLTLAALLLAQPALAAAGPVLPEDYRTPFSDVKEGDWFYPYVSDLNRRGMVNGYPDGRFGPRDVTRMGDSMIMILKAAGSGDLIPLPNAHYAASYAAYYNQFHFQNLAFKILLFLVSPTESSGGLMNT